MNRIVIAAPGVGPRWLGCYGNERVGTPHLDAVAAEAAVYDRHYVGDPAAARAEWGGGPGILVHAGPRDPAAPEFYAQFSRVFAAAPRESDPTRVEGVLRVLADLADDLPEPFTLFLELVGLVPPWDVPQDVFDAYLDDLRDGEPTAEIVPWTAPRTGWFDRDDFESWELLHRTFLAAVTTFDADLGKLFAFFRTRGWDETATWAVTSEFGYALGEHGVVGPYRPWLHDEIAHVPLIVRPAGGGAGFRVAGLTQPADLWAAVAGDVVPRAAAVSTWRLDGAAERAIRTAAWTLIQPVTQHADDADEPREAQLYAFPADRFEVHDVASANEDVAAQILLLNSRPADHPPAAKDSA